MTGRNVGLLMDDEGRVNDSEERDDDEFCFTFFKDLEKIFRLSLSHLQDIKFPIDRKRKKGLFKEREKLWSYRIVRK